MNVDSIIELYPHIEKLIGGRYPFALGGYPALVKQGILKESRETKDVDLCVFTNRDYQSGGAISYFNHNLHINLENWNNYFKKTLEDNVNYEIQIEDNSFSLNSEKSVKDQKDKLLLLLGIDKMATISLIRNVNSLKNKIVYNASEMTSKYLLKTAIFFNKFSEINDINKIQFDLFFLNFTKINNSTVIIDGIRYVDYYVILKAKYEYCLNKLTNDKSFEKHINDLNESFNIVHIDGVNFPKNVDFLIKKRENEKNK